MNTVSVIIPAYNASAWIQQAIDSCLSQTYRGIEIVAIDDGSTDDTPGILRGYGQQVIWERGPNHGPSHARNRGFALSSGDFVQYLDADDYLLPEKIARQLTFLEQTGADVVYGDWRHLYHNPDGTRTFGKIAVSGRPADMLEALLGGWWTANMSLLLRRDIVKRAGGWDVTLKGAEDGSFFISVAMCGADIRYQPGCYSVYRRYGPITTSTADIGRWLECEQRLLEKAQQQLASSDRLSERYRRALARSYFSLARNYYDTDRDRYRQLLNWTLSLDPAFRPPGSLPFRSVQRLFGLELAEHLASYKRRLLRIRRLR